MDIEDRLFWIVVAFTTVATLLWYAIKVINRLNGHPLSVLNHGEDFDRLKELIRSEPDTRKLALYKILLYAARGSVWLVYAGWVLMLTVVWWGLYWFSGNRTFGARR